MAAHILNGRPDIDDTGATVKARGGAGYAPPGPGQDFIRMGRFGSEAICDPYECQDALEDDD